MTQRFDFMDFLQSRNQLLAAVKKTPNVGMHYKVVKYCKMPLGESKEVREYISLKPNDLITVEWLYNEGVESNPLPSVIKVNDQTFAHFYTYDRLISWLQTNTETDKQNWIL